MPELLKAPPLPEVFAPVTVTPEMLRLPPVLMLKILKLPLLASMVIEEAPSPLMVTVPAVPPVIAVLELMMFGNAEAKVIMVTGELEKLMMSLPGVVLALIMACRRESAPLSLVFRTVMVAGTILPSSWRSWEGGAGSSCFSILGVAKEPAESI